jgi:hypothetical protein
MSSENDRALITCPHCWNRLSVPRTRLGSPVICPRCHQELEATEGGFGQEAIDEIEYAQPVVEDAAEDPSGRVCSLLSVLFGGLSFLACVFGPSGCILALLGLVRSRHKSLATFGLLASMVGMIVNLILFGLINYAINRGELQAHVPGKVAAKHTGRVI